MGDTARLLGWLAAGLGLGGVIAWGASRNRKAQEVVHQVSTEVQEAAEQAEDWIRRVVMHTAGRESGSAAFSAVNPNRDGAGTSYGLVQWTQKSGNLGKLLEKMHAADPDVFAATFGPYWSELLWVVQTPDYMMGPVGGVLLWREPWVSRFRAAGKVPAFQAVQMTEARTGEHFRGAVDAARIMRIATERALSLFYDTSIQQGPGRAREVARWVLANISGDQYTNKLQAYADRAVAIAPVAYRSDVQRRRYAILVDPALSDEGVSL